LTEEEEFSAVVFAKVDCDEVEVRIKHTLLITGVGLLV